MGPDKMEAYAALVKERKACRVCAGLVNPSEFQGKVHDVDEIGAWSRWQGNLDARLLVVGQDWGDTGYFEKYAGKESDDNPSNRNMMALLQWIGITVPPPSAAEISTIFLTNAILCLKKGGLGAKVKREWFENCGKRFLKPLNDIVRPQVVASLGEHAFRSMRSLYSLPRLELREAVEKKAGFLLAPGVSYFPMYHCSPRVLTKNRVLARQKEDWERVKACLG